MGAGRQIRSKRRGGHHRVISVMRRGSGKEDGAIRMMRRRRRNGGRDRAIRMGRRSRDIKDYVPQELPVNAAFISTSSKVLREYVRTPTKPKRGKERVLEEDKDNGKELEGDERLERDTRERH